VKYDKYSIEDFLTDKEFVNWVKNPSDESTLFWTRWIKEHEHKKPVIIEAIHIIRSIRFREENVSPDQLVANLDRIISAKQNDSGFLRIKKNTEHKLFHNRLYWIAASFALIISATIITLIFNPLDNTEIITENNTIVKQNPQGQKSTFLLPDSTVVSLNAESTLSYPENFAGDTREVTLEGEAFFNVHRNIHKPFVVTSGSLSTRALGTSFNVKAFKNDETISVSLNTGKVVIENGQPADKIYLEPGEKFIYNIHNKENKKIRFDPRDDLAWKEGILYFRQSDLAEFVSRIERWYGVNVMVIGAPKKDWKINGRFENESLRNVLESLSFARQINYEMKDKNVVIFFN